ncbi:MAG: hypothetical protein NVSMB14_05280 [Isosphaeraceae bacterium]
MFRKPLRAWAFVLIGFGLATTTAALAPADDPKPEEIKIVGHYRAEGTLPNNGKYSANLTIRAKGDVFELIWSAPGEGASYSGTGIRRGDVLATSWIIHGPVPLTGVMIYKITKGPKLDADWAIHPSDGKIYKEVCVKADE